MNSRRSLAVLLLVAGVFVLWPPQSASGHAALVRSDPTPNAFLQRAPSQVTLTFSETVDSHASSVTVLDANGKRLQTPSAQVSDDAHTLQVSLPALSPGIFNVLWSNVSTVDGHALQGSFPFTLLNPDGSLPAETNRVSGLSTESDPPPLADGVAVRSLALLGMLLSAGAALLLLLWPEAGDGARRGLARMIVLGAAMIALAGVLNLVTLREAFSNTSLVNLLLTTRSGGFLVARLGAALFIVSVATFLDTAPRRAAGASLVALGICVWAFAATSHAAAGTGSAIGTTIDALHRSAAITWLGAVVGVAVAARLAGRDERYRLLMPRFSLLASVMVFVLLASGLLNAFTAFDEVGRLGDTRYGLTLVAKLGLMVPLLGVAFYNARRAAPRLMLLLPGEPRRFLVLVSIEAALGIGVFFAAAMLTQTTVARSVPQSGSAGAYDRSSPAGDVTATLHIDPNHTGLNVYAVHLTDTRGNLVKADLVRLTFRYLDDSSVGPATLQLATTSGESWSGQGPYLTLEGSWRVEVEIRRPDVNDVEAFFDVRPAGAPVLQLSAGSAWDNPAPALTWNQFGGIVMVLFGLGFALWGGRLGHIDRRVGWASNGATIAGFGLGALLLFGVHSHTSSSGGSVVKNPIFPDQNSISTGKRLFEQNCLACHGQNGVPPRGLNLNPYPLDLTVHVPLHSDGQIYSFIAKGVPGSAMRAWGDGQGSLTSDQVWHLVNFLRTLTPADQ